MMPGNPNKYAGPCIECGDHVAAGVGTFERSWGKWKPVHHECQQSFQARKNAHRRRDKEKE